MSIVLITGASKGLGRESARQMAAAGHTVYAGARDEERGRAAAQEVGARFVRLDVTDDASVAALAVMQAEQGRLDVLVNNAGIADPVLGADRVTGARTLECFDTNAVGLVRVTQAALPALRASEHPVIVNVSSALGSFGSVTDPATVQLGYDTTVCCATKAAVSMLTVHYAKALPGMKVNAVEPGATATDFTGGHGQDVADGAAVIVGLASTGPEGPTGTFQQASGELVW